MSRQAKDKNVGIYPRSLEDPDRPNGIESFGENRAMQDASVPTGFFNSSNGDYASNDADRARVPTLLNAEITRHPREGLFPRMPLAM
jgi:hypothetical protein